MAITLATRVSQALRKGGIQTVLPGSSFWGVKVSNTYVTGRDLAVTRRAGHPVVTVKADFELEATAIRRASMIIEVLTSAGYRAEVSEDSPPYIVDVWEPGWEAYVGQDISRQMGGPPVSKATTTVPEPAPQAATGDLVARKNNNGSYIVHATTCPSLAVRLLNHAPGNPVPLKTRTREDIVAELFGDAVAKRVSFDPCTGLHKKTDRRSE
jgi:hypothetical protein